MIEVSRLDGRKGIILACKEKPIRYYAKFGYTNIGISNSVHGVSKWYNMILEF